jgi:DNA-directed RNA polymerase subunit alpha
MSNHIHTPGIVNVDDHNANSATFAVEPLHSGYGMTLGNSLRRVLLSSIAGAAVTSFKIGYRTIEEGTAKKQSDYIALDAIFSPVLRVRYKVENTRVGQATDLDRLLLTVDTDGSITPRDAFEEAAAILVNQYTSLAGKTRVAAPVAEVAGAAGDGGLSDEPTALNTSIEDLNLSARTTNALINNDIHTIKDLFALNDAELRDLKGFGSKALDEVKEKLAELEL